MPLKLFESYLIVPKILQLLLSHNTLDNKQLELVTTTFANHHFILSNITIIRRNRVEIVIHVSFVNLPNLFQSANQN